MKVLRMLCSLILVLCVTFTVLVGAKKIDSSGVSADRVEYKGVLSLWQVDSFEGGAGSRKQFLLKAARTFERKNQGVLVMVSQMTEEGVKEKLDSGETPDLISFGPGVQIRSMLELSAEKRVKGGVVGNKLFAAAWCRGGYVLIENPAYTKGEDCVIVSQQKYTQPLLTLLYGDLRIKEVEILPPMDAYVKFVSGKAKYLLGTQRDVVRLENRGFSYKYKVLDGYNDLYQYVAVTSPDSIKSYYAKEFVEHLVSDDVQTSLSEIKMLSPYLNVNNGIEALDLMQKTNCKYTVSAFTSCAQLDQLKNLSLAALRGDEGSLNKIKNILL